VSSAYSLVKTEHASVTNAKKAALPAAWGLLLGAAGDKVTQLLDFAVDDPFH
jgi:hypothetical protein